LFKNKHTAIEKPWKQGFLCGLFQKYIRRTELQLNEMQRVEWSSRELAVAVEKNKQQTIST
jgi:hypothetical protein